MAESRLWFRDSGLTPASTSYSFWDLGFHLSKRELEHRPQRGQCRDFSEVCKVSASKPGLSPKVARVCELILS